MKHLNKLTGQKGESLAVKLLENKGYRVLCKNFSVRHGEIDIIASYRDVLVFAEVKTKVGDYFGSPEEMVNWKKIKQIKKAAELFLLKYPEIAKMFDRYRIDVIAIVLSKESETIRMDHYENVDV